MNKYDTEENFKKFCKIFFDMYHIDCYDLSCEMRDCSECSIFQDEYENFLIELEKKENKEE